ncbi:MAG: proprotein convertase P-domain-containing protein [Desulfobulbaceae bacterium]|jgi:subtilisin-like proprotein convertase family protein|nr:proprotein convertase P-domain-containing protein [Desulfobulbaceae bacterium]
MFAPLDDGTLNSWSLILETTDLTIPSSDVPKPLPDLTTTTSIITSCNTGQIVDLNVQLDITHTWNADLDIFLIAPDASRIELSTDNGGSGDNYSGTIFDDEAATSITAGTPPFAGSYQPESPLSVLDGSTADGVWTLEITDDEGGITGTLNSWRLIFTTVASAYTLSTYADGLPSIPAGLTVDRNTLNFYYADYDSCEGVLRKIAPNGTVSTVTTDFTPNGDAMCFGTFYPYVETDIQFMNNSIYVPLGSESVPNGELVKIDTTNGTATTIHTFSGFGLESGIAAWNGNLLVTSGNGPAAEIRSYNPVSNISAAVLDISPLPRVYDVAYDPGHDAAYFWSESLFFRADLGAGSYSAIPGHTTNYADFAVSPDGNFLFTTNHPNIDVVTIADGSSETLFNGLTYGSRHDMVVAPSSTGAGCSLYVVDGPSILEISGISGNCKPFPWTMFLPAIHHK